MKLAPVLSSLLEPSILTAEGRPEELAADAELLPEELNAIKKAVPRRRAQYAATRRLARELFCVAGVPAAPVLNREDRSPIWPAGLVGSITHTDDWCGVALVPDGSVRGVGIDAENAKRLEPGMVDRLLTENERQALAASEQDPRDWATLWFSAKESVYKAIFADVKRFVGFEEVEVSLDPVAQTFSVRAHSPELAQSHGALVASLRGRYARHASLWVTSCILPRGAIASGKREHG